MTLSLIFCLTEFDNTEYKFPWGIRKGYGMLTGDVSSSGYLIPSLWDSFILSSLQDGRSIACPIRMSQYIFLIYNIYYLSNTCIDFYDISAWGGHWFVVYIRRFIYKFLNVCPLDYTAVARTVKVDP